MNLLNQNPISPFDCDRDGLADNLGYANARPSSFHHEGFNVAYADTTVRSFFVDKSNPTASYELYKSQMTPAGGD